MFGFWVCFCGFALRLCLLVLFMVWFGLLGVVCVVILLVACFGYCDFEIVVGFYLPWCVWV